MYSCRIFLVLHIKSVFIVSHSPNTATIPVKVDEPPQDSKQPPGDNPIVYF